MSLDSNVDYVIFPPCFFIFFKVGVQTLTTDLEAQNPCPYTLRYIFEARHNPYADIAYYYRGLPNSRDNLLSVAREEGGVVQEPYLRYEHEYDNLGNLISTTELVRQPDDSWEVSYTRAYFYTYLD